jgi:hypothetical protein
VAQLEAVAVDFEFLEMVGRSGHGTGGKPTSLETADLYSCVGLHLLIEQISP